MIGARVYMDLVILAQPPQSSVEAMHRVNRYALVFSAKKSEYP
jgi:hypothetical protein